MNAFNSSSLGHSRDLTFEGNSKSPWEKWIVVFDKARTHNVFPGRGAYLLGNHP